MWDFPRPERGNCVSYIGRWILYTEPLPTWIQGLDSNPGSLAPKTAFFTTKWLVLHLCSTSVLLNEVWLEAPSPTFLVEVGRSLMVMINSGLLLLLKAFCPLMGKSTRPRPIDTSDLEGHECNLPFYHPTFPVSCVLWGLWPSTCWNLLMFHSETSIMVS